MVVNSVCSWQTSVLQEMRDKLRAIHRRVYLQLGEAQLPGQTSGLQLRLGLHWGMQVPMHVEAHRTLCPEAQPGSQVLRTMASDSPLWHVGARILRGIFGDTWVLSCRVLVAPIQKTPAVSLQVVLQCHLWSELLHLDVFLPVSHPRSLRIRTHGLLWCFSHCFHSSFLVRLSQFLSAIPPNICGSHRTGVLCIPHRRSLHGAHQIRPLAPPLTVHWNCSDGFRSVADLDLHQLPQSSPHEILPAHFH